ncbi:hypothetical protein GCM10007938_42520 [Vibrio zhanjiangensis]|uniref:Uncharacterized protein n=1 Tax=Vibrio zhanjiangensis TaxID=1046128 RepID=A0ABQ6F4J8_9VIBR|nr:hypothetical protein [Vibrio zhanjiangensis]GLT20467.1 hypothetical protein GCM10007938_42520 [Vibrio zhanjiangensis]
MNPTNKVHHHRTDGPDVDLAPQMSAIQATLNKRKAYTKPHCLIIEGRAGFGKSTLAALLKLRFPHAQLIDSAPDGSWTFHSVSFEPVDDAFYLIDEGLLCDEATLEKLLIKGNAVIFVNKFQDLPERLCRQPAFWMQLSKNFCWLIQTP